MIKADQVKFFESFVEKQKTIMLSKGDDYSGQDRLSNFKKAGAICGLKAELNCLSLIATKVARLGELLSGKEPKNESIEDSLLDLANYTILLAMIREDQKCCGKWNEEGACKCKNDPATVNVDRKRKVKP